MGESYKVWDKQDPSFAFKKLFDSSLQFWQTPTSTLHGD